MGDVKTPEEIKKGLECCRVTVGCKNCPYNTGEFGCHLRNRDDALAYIQQLEAQVPRWVNVQDELPAPFVPVLVYMPGERPFPTVREGYINPDGHWFAGGYARDADEVTYWTEAPEPPEKPDLVQLDELAKSDDNTHKGEVDNGGGDCSP